MSCSSMVLEGSYGPDCVLRVSRRSAAMQGVAVPLAYIGDRVVNLRNGFRVRQRTIWTLTHWKGTSNILNTSSLVNRAWRLNPANGNHAGMCFTNPRRQVSPGLKNPKDPGTASLVNLHNGNMSHIVAPGPPALAVLCVASLAIAMKGSSQSRTVYPYAILRISPATGKYVVVVNPRALAQSSRLWNQPSHLLNLRT